jgi:hypothetical protein
MKYILPLALVALTCLPAMAGHRQRVVVQRQRVVVQQVHVPRQRVVVQQVVVPHHVQQFVAPQQFNAGCHQNGTLQFNAGGCQNLFR